MTEWMFFSLVLLFRHPEGSRPEKHRKEPKPLGCEENPAGLGSAWHPSPTCSGRGEWSIAFRGRIRLITGVEGCPLCFANSPFNYAKASMNRCFQFLFKAEGVFHKIIYASYEYGIGDCGNSGKDHRGERTD